MPPSEDAQLLRRIVGRHLRTLAFSLDEQFPAEDWGFSAQQAVEKLLRCLIVLADGNPSRSHQLDLLARETNLNLTNLLLDLQPLCGGSALQDRRFQTSRRSGESARGDSRVSGPGSQCHRNTSQGLKSACCASSHHSLLSEGITCQAC